MSFVVPFQYNQEKKQELQYLIDNGTITFNYEINCNTFTKSEDEHEDVINSWMNQFGNISEFQVKIQNMYTAKKAKIFKKSIGICDMGNRKFKIVLLCFDKPDVDGDRPYGELLTHLWLKSNDKNAKTKILAYTEELAGLIIARGNNNYTLE